MARILAAALAVAATPASSAVELSLKADATVAGARVTLGDVAVVEDADGTVAAGLATVDLGAAPLPGYTQRLTRREIERQLRSRGLGISWARETADAVRVERAVWTFDTTQVVDRAAAHLRAQLGPDNGRTVVQLSAPAPDVLLPAGEIELRPRPLAATLALRRHVTVWVDLLVDGDFQRTVPVSFNVRSQGAVLVARNDLPAGTTPTCEALQQQETDVAALDGPPASSDCRTVRGRLKRRLMQGEVLLKTHLQVPSAVTQGESVNLHVDHGAVMLETRAIALADGEVGQRIDVRTSGGTAAIPAEIIAPGVVAIHNRTLP